MASRFMINKWITCESIPNPEIYFSLHQGIECNELIVVQGAERYGKEKESTIYVFDTQIEKWIKYKNCPQMNCFVGLQNPDAQSHTSHLTSIYVVCAMKCPK
eukprot:277796_1